MRPPSQRETGRSGARASAFPWGPRRLGLATIALLVAALSFVFAARSIDRWRLRILLGAPLEAERPLYDRLWDRTPLQITATLAWQKVPWTTTVDQVRSDPTVWRLMFVHDWDGVPEPLRTEALGRIWNRFSGLVRAPARWDHMSASDWDEVPQPIRAMAFIEMIRYGAATTRSACNMT